MKNQFKLLSNLLYHFEEDFFEVIYKENKDRIKILIDEFYSDITHSKSGYPTRTVKKTPFIEETIRDIFEKGNDKRYKIKRNTPFLCLTHDVDYIYPTFVQNLKRVVGRRDFNISFNRKAYLESLEKYLLLDQNYGKSTLFAALPQLKLQGLKGIKQWIIDPSYSSKDKEFETLIGLMKKFNVDLGLHGSFYSIENEFFKLEVEGLKAATGMDVNLCRQHWLNVNKLSDLEQIRANGIRIDSTLGWNGHLGYRCGMARPYPIVLNNKEIIWEVPMLLMDGVLFDELGLDEIGVIKQSQKILDEVFKMNGGTSLNWHERTYAKDYKWGNAYKVILEYAKDKGFQFLSLQEAVNLYE